MEILIQMTRHLVLIPHERCEVGQRRSIGNDQACYTFVRQQGTRERGENGRIAREYSVDECKPDA